MRSFGRSLFAGSIAALAVATATPPAAAQGYGPSGSLGGYGAAPIYSSPGVGGSRPMVIPYGGTFEGFMPSRMGGGGSLNFGDRPPATMTTGPTPFRLNSGMSRGFSTRPLMGSGPGMGRRVLPGSGGMGVMPPNFGYPFRQPPSLLPSGATASGMPM